MRYLATFFLVLVTVAPGHAQIGRIYTPHERNTHLGIIDPSTGDGIDVGSFEQPEPGYRLLSNAFDTQGSMFSIAMLPGNTGHQLLSVDLATGVATKIAPTSDVPILGMEIDTNDVMYAMRYVIPETLEGDPILFTMDKSSGELTPIGDTGVVRSMDLAFDTEGTLWLVGGPDGGNKLYTLDTSTGASTFVADITGVEEATEPSIEIMGIMFDEDNNLYGTAFRPAPEPNDFLSPLFSIDTTTGAATVIGQTGLRLPHGGDYLIPEPSSSLLLLLGLGGLLMARRASK